MAGAFAPGSSFGRYRIVQELGRGGMGAVLHAEDAETGQPVALKVILGEHRTNEDFLARFRREARAAAAVAHPGIVRLVDSGVEAGCPFIAFELVEGASLAGRLREAGPLPWREVAAIGADVARALAAVHAAGLVHRDLKPDNVLVGADGRPRISDFGLVRASGGAVLGTTGVLTKTGEVLGTPAFASPEQADGTRAIDGRTDLYGLGATLFALLTGQPPFEGEGYSVLKKVLLERPPALGKLVQGVPERLERLVEALLEKDPSRRPQSADEVARELETIAREETGASRRGLPAVAGVALVTLLAIAASAYALGRGREKPGPSPPVTSSVPPDRKPAPPTPSRAVEEGPPEWFKNAPKSKRPRLPLPGGLKPGSGPGEYVNEKDGSVLVYVPAGAFRMGRNQEDMGTSPRHDVELSAYFIGKYEVSNEQFEAFVKATGHVTGAEKRDGCVRVRPPPDDNTGDGTDPAHVEGWEARGAAHWRDPAGDGKGYDPSHPVVQVAVADAEAYCKWAGLRLPTEAQWERAASGPKANDPLPWGDVPIGKGGAKQANVADASLQRLRSGFNNAIPDYDDGYATTAPVRSFLEGASSFGALHMAGNVWEWCADGYDRHAYERHAKKDPIAPPLAGVDARPIRGGSFTTEWVDVVRRTGLMATASCDDIGFRVARDGR